MKSESYITRYQLSVGGIAIVCGGAVLGVLYAVGFIPEHMGDRRLILPFGVGGALMVAYASVMHRVGFICRKTLEDGKNALEASIDEQDRRLAAKFGYVVGLGAMTFSFAHIIGWLLL